MVVWATSGSKPFVFLDNMRVAAQIFQLVATAVAFIVGGIFTWYKFLRTGELDPRLQPAVTGKAVVNDNTVYVVATATVLNTGAVDVDLRGGSAAVEIYVTRPEDDAFEYENIARVFEDHDNIQPGETLEDQAWFEFPYDGHVGVRLELVVVILNRREKPPVEVLYPTTGIVGLIGKNGGSFTEDG